MLKKRSILLLALVILVLGIFVAIPVMGTANFNLNTVNVQTSQSDVAHEQPAVEIACDDPGSSGGDNGGC